MMVTAVYLRPEAGRRNQMGTYLVLAPSGGVGGRRFELGKGLGAVVICWPKSGTELELPRAGAD